MVKGIFIPAEDMLPIVEDEYESLAEYQDAVDGYIEPVDLVSQGCTIYVNEEGLLRQLPFNPRATFIWWFYVPEARQKATLVGHAVVVGVPDRTGESTDVPEEIRQLLLHEGSFWVEVKVLGDERWYRNQAVFGDVSVAMVWGMLLLDRWSLAEDVRVVINDDASTE